MQVVVLEGKEGEVAPQLNEVSIIQRQVEEEEEEEEQLVKRQTVVVVVEALGLKQSIIQVAYIVIRFKQLIKSKIISKKRETVTKIKMRSWIYFSKLLRRRKW